MRKCAGLLTLLALSGCAVQLTTQAQNVQVATTVDGRRCQDLGMVLGSNAMGLTMSQDREGAINEAKNLASDKGANIIVIEGNTSNMAQTTVVARAYYCKE